MTPVPRKEDLLVRSRYNPDPNDFNITNFRRQLKDGEYSRDFVSDFVISVIFFATKVKEISQWESTLFQLPFKKALEFLREKKERNNILE